MSLENAHKLIRIYMGGLILGVNTLYMLSCFQKQFALVGKGLRIGGNCRDTNNLQMNNNKDRYTNRANRQVTESYIIADCRCQ